MSENKVELQVINDASLSIHRKKYGRGYRYYDDKDNLIKNKPLLKRLKALVIPPMWSNVQICKWDDGHIQAIGRDLKGRKQYIYHSEWERRRQEKKFAKIIDFGSQLTKIRKRAMADTQRQKWEKEKILGLLALVLDETGIRIGNQQYVDRNGTYGLTTLRRKHMSIENGAMTFEYKGKSNKMREVTIEDDELIKLVRKTAQLPGYELFRYRDEMGNFTSIDSDDVNQYIKEVMGEEFYSKDFRTWVATRMAVELYPEAVRMKKDQPRKKFTNILLRMVADELGNTPTVCKSYYVHPEIMQGIESQSLPLYENYTDDEEEYGLAASEKLILDFVKK